MLAAQNGYCEIAQILLDGGARINARTLDGKTALSLAAGFNHPDIVKLLTGVAGNIRINLHSPRP